MKPMKTITINGETYFVEDSDPVTPGGGENAAVIGSGSAIGDHAVAMGKDTMAGCMGYYIAAIDPANNHIYLHTGEDAVIPTWDNPSSLYDETFESGYQILNDSDVDAEDYTPYGNEFSVSADSYFHWAFAGNVTEISGNRITYSSETLNKSKEWLSNLNNGADPFTFFIPTQPNIGLTNIGTGSVAEGWNTHAAGQHSHAEGYYSIVAGRYGHAEGNSTRAGFAAHAEGIDTLAGGLHSHAEGFSSTASGNTSHAEGFSSTASSYATHAEGYKTVASIYAAHAEGDSTHAEGSASHAEGFSAVASGDYAHSEGRRTTASGGFSHAEGNETVAKGTASHAEGRFTTTSGNQSHAEGYLTIASGSNSHAEGGGYSTKGPYCRDIDWGTGGLYISSDNTSVQDFLNEVPFKVDDYILFVNGNGTFYRVCNINVNYDGEWYAAIPTCIPELPSPSTLPDEYYVISSTTASGVSSHAEGNNTKASGDNSHAEGNNTKASGNDSHAEGNKTIASGYTAHAEGNGTTASGSNSHAEGNATTASGNRAHAEGISSTASGSNSHAEGYSTIASGYAAHAEGNDTIASGSGAHAEGYLTKATNTQAHAEGYKTEASGDNSHAEGNSTIASGMGTHAEGLHSVAASRFQHVQGQYNIIDNSNTYAHIVGKGTDDSGRANIHTLDWNGNAWYKGAITSNGADYAELFEWEDGNPNNEDRIGYAVTLVGEQIKLANSGDEILGIVSGTAALIGDNYECEWNGKYLTDEFGRIQYEDVEEFADTIVGINEETQEPIVEKVSLGMFRHPKLNPNYDSTKPYVNRINRQEWDIIGMLGKLYLHDDGTCVPNQHATVGENGVATASTEKTNMRVLARVNENIVKVLLK